MATHIICSAFQRNCRTDTADMGLYPSATKPIPTTQSVALELPIPVGVLLPLCLQPLDLVRWPLSCRLQDKQGFLRPWHRCVSWGTGLLPESICMLIGVVTVLAVSIHTEHVLSQTFGAALIAPTGKRAAAPVSRHERLAR